MNTLEKASALNALSEISIKTRGINDWYVNQSTEIKEGGILAGKYGNGPTPDAAIDDHWEQLTGSRQRIVLNAGDPALRREVIWNGYMWADA